MLAPGVNRRVTFKANSKEEGEGEEDGMDDIISAMSFKSKNSLEESKSGPKPIPLDSLKRIPLYGPLNGPDMIEYLKRSKERFLNLYYKECPFMANPADFDHIKLLGKGAFGQVILVMNKKDHTLLAVKALEKKHILKMKQIPHALNEKRILQCLDSPFTVRMEYYAKDNSYIYFYLPFIQCGEMFHHLETLGHFSEPQARFYAAQVILALEYLHFLKFVYRDLKPENLLVDHHGYLKMTDFGFAKPILSRTYTFCGTPHYLAPEVIAGRGYGFSVDWWSLGVLIYEMNRGVPPYDADDQMHMFKLILHNKYSMPLSFSSPLKDLVAKLLETDITKRYGNLKNGVEDVKHHAWFNSINWSELFNRRTISPYTPPPMAELHNQQKSGDTKSLLKTSDVNEYEEEFKDF